MTEHEAKQVIAALRFRGPFSVGNSAYGKWGFSYDQARGQYRYESEFWGDDPEHPRIEEEWLTEDELHARLVSTYPFAPHFAKFVGSADQA
jgi:hypothetical protein